MRGKIIPNISTFNVEYRVVRKILKNKDGTVTLMNGEPCSFLQIYEIHFGKNGEIIAIATPAESPYGDDLEGLKYEIKEYRAALKKPILNWEFIKDQIKRTRRKWLREKKKGTEATNVIHESLEAMEKVKSGNVTVKLEDYYKEIDHISPVFTSMPYKEVIKKFKLNTYTGE